VLVTHYAHWTVVHYAITYSVFRFPPVLRKEPTREIVYRTRCYKLFLNKIKQLGMIDSICLSVCHSPVSPCHVKMTQATIMQSSLEDSTMTLVSSWLTSARNFKQNMGSWGAE